MLSNNIVLLWNQANKIQKSMRPILHFINVALEHIAT